MHFIISNSSWSLILCLYFSTESPDLQGLFVDFCIFPRIRPGCHKLFTIMRHKNYIMLLTRLLFCATIMSAEQVALRLVPACRKSPNILRQYVKSHKSVSPLFLLTEERSRLKMAMPFRAWNSLANRNARGAGARCDGRQGRLALGLATW